MLSKLFTILSNICERSFASPRGTLSSKRIGGAILLTFAILEIFIIVMTWALFSFAILLLITRNPANINLVNLKMFIPIEIIYAIISQFVVGAVILGYTLKENDYKVIKKIIDKKTKKELLN